MILLSTCKKRTFVVWYKAMIEITENEWQADLDKWQEKAEKGEVVLIKKPDGAKILMVPQDPADLSGLCDI